MAECRECAERDAGPSGVCDSCQEHLRFAALENFPVGSRVKVILGVDRGVGGVVGRVYVEGAIPGHCLLVSFPDYQEPLFAVCPENLKKLD